MLPLAKFALEAHAFGDLKSRDETSLDLLAGRVPEPSSVTVCNTESVFSILHLVALEKWQANGKPIFQPFSFVRYKYLIINQASDGIRTHDHLRVRQVS